MQAVLDLPMATDQRGGGLSGVVFREQIEPPGVAGLVARYPLGDDVNKGLQMRPAMDVREILRHIVDAV